MESAHDLRTRHSAAQVLFGISGFCALALETSWIRRYSLLLGDTAITSTLVVALFFAGAALGSGLAGAGTRRLRDPMRAFGAAEAAAGLLALAAIVTQRPLAGPGYPIWLQALGMAALIAPYAALSGFGLPLMARHFVRKSERLREAGPLYAAHLAGSAAGVLLGGLILPAAAGYLAASTGIALLQIVSGLFAFVLLGRKLSEPPASPSQTSWSPGLFMVCVSGIGSIGFEILSLHLLRQTLLDSIYTTASIFFAFLVCLASGAWAASRSRMRAPAALCLAATAMAAAPWLLHPAVVDPLNGAMQEVFSPLVSTAMTVLILLFPVATPLGMVFPSAWEAYRQGDPGHGAAMGAAAFWNKLACAAGALLVTFALVPALGPSRASASLGIAYLAAALLFRPASRRIQAAAAMALLLSMALPADRTAAAGHRELASYWGPYGAVSVTVDERGSHHILFNHHYMLNGTEGSESLQKDTSWIPLLLAPRARDILFIGSASGISASASLSFPLDSLEAVELVPDVARAAREHFAPWNARLFSDPRSRVVIDDGRHYLAATREQKRDLIISDLFFPSMESTSNLYSKEFFELVRGSLSSEGVFCLWIPLYQMDAEQAGIVIHTLLEAFPSVIAIRASWNPYQTALGLIASGAPLDLSARYLEKRLREVSDSRLLASSPFLRSVDDLRLAIVGDIAANREVFSRFPINSDNLPRFAYVAARTAAPAETIQDKRFTEWTEEFLPLKGFASIRVPEGEEESVRKAIEAGRIFFATASAGTMNAIRHEGQSVILARQRELFARGKSLFPTTHLRPIDIGR